MQTFIIGMLGLLLLAITPAILIYQDQYFGALLVGIPTAFVGIIMLACIHGLRST